MDDTNLNLLPVNPNDNLSNPSPAPSIPPKASDNPTSAPAPKIPVPSQPSAEEVSALATDFLNKLENGSSDNTPPKSPSSEDTTADPILLTPPPVLQDAEDNPTATPLSSVSNDLSKEISNDLPQVANTEVLSNPSPLLSSTPDVSSMSDPAPSTSVHETPSPFSSLDTAPASPPLANFNPPTPTSDNPSDFSPKPDLPPPPPEINITQTVSTPSKLPKIIFTISLLIFLSVSGFLAYNLYLAANRPDTSVPETSKPIDEAETIPENDTDEGAEVSGAPTSGCAVNDKTYAFEETFKAEDGCNTCTCQTDGTIVCTTTACEASSSPTTTLKSN